MNRENLFDLIRRVKEVSGVSVPIIVGSQSLYAVTDQVPHIVRGSLEADFLLAGDDSDARGVVNKTLGVTSNFYDEHGYFADGLGLATVVLVAGWRDRLQPLKNDAGQIVAHCLELYDLCVSKLMAGRDKDMTFLCNLLDGRMIMMAPLMERTEMVKETAYDGALIPRLQRFEAHLRSQRHVNYNLQPVRELLARLK